jgi:hypothetical protein
VAVICASLMNDDNEVSVSGELVNHSARECDRRGLRYLVRMHNIRREGLGNLPLHGPGVDGIL